jgi:hypothetical protein
MLGGCILEVEWPVTAPFIDGEDRVRTMRLHDLLHNVEKPDGPPLAAS